MARVTVEDCIRKIDSCFDLVVLASQRTRELAAGAPLTIEKTDDKNTIISLREIAAGGVSPENLKESIIGKLQKKRSPMVEDVESMSHFRSASAVAGGQEKRKKSEENIAPNQISDLYQDQEV